MIFLYGLLVIILLYLGVFAYWGIKYFREGKRRIKSKYKKEKPVKWWYKLFVQFPKYFMKYWYERNPDEFTEKGIHIIAGEQGTGKSVTAVYLLREWKRQFPAMKIATNMRYRDEDSKIESWQNIVFQNNGEYGQVDLIDELPAWFNSLESKNFPPEMMSEVSQQRKQRKVILGTSQVENRIAKPIREQCFYLYKPYTLFGCLTICFKYKPKIDSEGTFEKLRLRKVFFFVQTEDIRDSFDTYHKIKAQSLKGLKPYSEQMGYIRHSVPDGSGVGGE